MLLSLLPTTSQNHKQKVNALNVFPVPDGDTGTNMSMTISAAKREVQLMDSKATVAEVSKTAAGALLRGARGNSGVICRCCSAAFPRAWPARLKPLPPIWWTPWTPVSRLRTRLL